MSLQPNRLRPGDLVEVRPPDEIAKTLDTDGALGHLPFMPEMLDFCGQRFRVSRRALTICFSGEGGPRGFDADNVVTLDGVRCSGVAHDGCQKSCAIFWCEQWLRKVDRSSIPSRLYSPGMEQLRGRVKVSTSPETYYCQATELPKATSALSRSGRIKRYLRGFRGGNVNVLNMIRSVAIFLYWRVRRKFLGIYPRGNRTATPTESLNLQSGEWVEVKPMKSIIETLDERGRNRGLSFSTDMHLWCGRKLRVKRRLDKIITDGTGQMRQLKNTVCLEGSTCGCSYMGLGMADCSRCEFTYWREIWLKRCSENND
jgi:hypothetical protein